ncbi:MAG: aldose 1-epimerase [Bacillota bacterium]
MYTHGRKQGCRISLDYTYKGMRVAFLENEQVRVGVLVDKGADVFEFTYKPRDLDFMWQSPIPLQRPFAATSALPEGAFHDYYYGGWQEVLPSAGWASEPYLGASQGLHGEVSLLPFEAQVLEDGPERATLVTRTRCYRSPLTLERRMSVKRGKAALLIHERLQNESEEPFAVMWGHHPAIGEPFLDDSCMVTTPASTVKVHPFHPNGLWETGKDFSFPMVGNRRTGQLEDVTQVRSKATRSVDVLFFLGLREGWYGLTNRRQKVGFGMAWDEKLFKHLWMWQVYGGHNDYPWYGRTYNVALEPFTSYPPAGIANAVQNGTALVLKPGQVVETDLAAAAYEGEGLTRVDRGGTVQQ